MKTVLVLGGTRFIGRHLLEKLNMKMFNVYYFHRGVTSFCPSSNAIEILGDRTREEDVRNLFAINFDVIIDISGEEYEMVELTVRYAKKNQPYYVYISSSSVYSPSTKHHDEREFLVGQSTSYYTNTKIYSEKLIENSITKFAIVRTSKVYGPYNHIYREQYYIDKLSNNEQIALVNDPILHFTYVGDLIEGVTQLISKELVGIFNIAGKEPARLSCFIKTIAKKLNYTPTILWSSESDAPLTNLPTCVLSIQKMQNVCCWQPHYTLEEGIDYTLRHMKGKKMETENRIRVAFVPLKSTFIGLPRALLFNMLFRDSYGGKMVLRIDDTDELRAQPERLRVVFDTLRWLGINWDEGPDVGGPYTPYIQSERRSSYLNETERLINLNRAYRCFCKQSNDVYGCTGGCKEFRKTEIEWRLSEGQTYCIRYSINNETESYYDLIHGEIHKELKEISDPIIVRTDGSPTFHLATAVDEGALRITHIVRGVDHIESAFIQRQIMSDLRIELPQYAHFSIYESDGASIYADNLKGKYDVECLRKDGFLSGAIVNFLITSGYMPKGVDDCSLFSYSDFLGSFDLKNFSRSNQHYDFERLISINRKWIKSLSEEQYLSEIGEYFRFVEYNSQVSVQLLLVLKNHIDTLGDLIRKINVFFDDSETTVETICNVFGAEIVVLKKIRDECMKYGTWNQDELKGVFVECSAIFGKKDVTKIFVLR